MISKLVKVVCVCCLTTMIIITWLDKKYDSLVGFGKEIVEIQEEKFEDGYFKKILDVRMGLTAPLQTNGSFRSKEIPSFLLVAQDRITARFWTEPFKQISSNECSFKCSFTDDMRDVKNVDAILWFLRDIKQRASMLKKIPERDSSQPWVVLSFEAPPRGNSLYRTNYNDFNDIFNRTMTFRKDSDIIFVHGFVVHKKNAKYLPHNWIKPNNFTYRDKKVPQKGEAVIAGMVSNCNTKSGRLAYIKKLNRYIPVDLYGKCGDLKCGHSLYQAHAYDQTEQPCLKKIGAKYMFYLAFENAICKDYGTEKIYNMLYYPIVPIVLGGINYTETLPPDSYINAADFSPKELATYLNFLIDNPSEYEAYLQWREIYYSSTIGGALMLCDLCTQLHNSSFYEKKSYF